MKRFNNLCSVVAWLLFGTALFIGLHCTDKGTQPLEKIETHVGYNGLENFVDGNARGFIAIPLARMRSFAVEGTNAIPYAEMVAWERSVNEHTAFNPDVFTAPTKEEVRQVQQTMCALVCGNTVYVVTGCPDGSNCTVHSDCLTITPPTGAAKGLCCSSS